MSDLFDSKEEPKEEEQKEPENPFIPEIKLGEDYLIVKSDIDPEKFVVSLKRETTPAVRERFKDKVVYSDYEMRVLEKGNLDEKHLKRIHLAKKCFLGSVIEGIDLAKKDKGK